MLGIVKTINGVKQLVPLTTDSGQGLPLGAWTSFEDDQPRNGYLKAGTTFNQSEYPALYTMLGSNVVPDKGYGLDWDNAEAITLSTSDYVVQKSGWIAGYLYGGNGDLYVYINDVIVNRSSNSSFSNLEIEVKKGDRVKVSYSAISTQKLNFVPYLHPMFIKAVIGPIEDSAADQVVQTINNANSYSTEEVNTGKKWIDGKPIYRITVEDTANVTQEYSAISASAYTILSSKNIDRVITANWNRPARGSYNLNSIPLSIEVTSSAILKAGSTAIGYAGAYLTLEYTKTTD